MKVRSILTCLMFFVSINISNTAYAQAVNVNDSLALVDLYNSTDGPNWNNHTNWLTGPVNAWYGIKVVDTRVTEISLHKNHLEGVISPSLADIANLAYLNFSNNKLTGNIPSELGKLNLLYALYLDKNELTGIIPAELGKLDLGWLHLDHNQLSGTIPFELHSSVQLKLNHNLLTGVIPPSLGVIGLVQLDLSYNQLSGTIPPELGNMSSGSVGRGAVLNLSNNQLSGSIPPELGDESIEYLILSNNQLSGTIPPELGKIKRSPWRNAVLNFSYNQLTGSIPPELGNASNLDFSYNQLSGSIPFELGNLYGLNLSHNQLTGSIPPELVTSYKRRAGILWLDLSYNHLTGNIPSVRSTWHKRMWILHLNNNELTGEIPATFGKFTGITELWLQNNKLSGSIPARFSDIENKSCQINLSDNYFTFDGMERVATQFPNALYAPQANISLRQNTGSLYVSAGGRINKNTYAWFETENPNPTIITGDSLFHPSSSGKYYAAVTNSICTQLTLYTDTIDYDAVLPVRLINLKAQQQGGMVKVEWTSVTEINVDRYEIQRATDAQNFTGIGSVPATGNGTQRINYSFNDVKPLQGNNYYRLKAFDKDGALTYSNIVLVKMNSDKAITLVYPNPAKNMLNIQTNGSASFSLINQSGKIILTKAINNSGTINVSGVSAGVYYLKNNGTGEVKKIVITK